jgi:hypothetical protein
MEISLILRLRIVLIFYSLVLILGPASSMGQTEAFFRDIPDGAVVEGSTRYSGLQPDYIVDTEAKEFQLFWDLADSIRLDQSKSVPEKVAILTAEIRRLFADHHRYDDPVYRSLMAEYRELGTPIPLSKYISCKAGVCRESSFLLHLVLKRAGIANYHIYAKVLVQYQGEINVPEDHGFVVFKYNNERWIADSYFKQFNGYSFDEFLHFGPHAFTPTRNLFFAESRIERRSIVQINNFPRVHAPSSCATLIGKLL